MACNTPYNKYTEIRSMIYNILSYLIIENEEIWKLLKYDTPDALSNPNLTQEEKSELIYNAQEDETPYRIFRSPFVSDAFVVQNTQLRAYITSGIPTNRTVGQVNFAFEMLTHVKLVNLETYENRLEVMFQQMIETLNGKEIGGIGVLFFNKDASSYDAVRLNLYNNKNYIGYTLVMSTNVGG